VEYTASTFCLNQIKLNYLLVAGYLLGLAFEPEDGDTEFSKMLNLYSTTYHNIPKKMLFKITAVRT
jgi:hypothetical protein